MKKGVAQAPLVYQNGTQAGPLGLDGTGETGRTGPHHQHVKDFLQNTTAVLHVYSLDDESFPADD
jgi:hypothetical protein